MNFLILMFISFGILAGLLVISATNPIHSVFGLILLFINATGLLLTLQCDFLAMILLIIYVGAIAILFLFVIMMLNLNLTNLITLNENIFRYLPIGIIIGFLFLINIFTIAEEIGYISYESTYIINSINIFGNSLYDKYSIYFLIGSLILFVAMIGAIVITLQNTYMSRIQNTDLQLLRKKL